MINPAMDNAHETETEVSGLRGEYIFKNHKLLKYHKNRIQSSLYSLSN